MDSAQETLGEIASVSQRLVNATAVHLGHEGGLPIKTSRLQLSGDLHKIIATSLVLVESFKNSSDTRRDTLDERLNDWLMGREPAACLDTLNAMAELIREDVDKGAWKWLAMLPLAPSKDNIKEITTLFAERRDHFHFLLTTDVWNRRKHAQRKPGPSVQDNVIDLAMSNVTPSPRVNVQISEELPMSTDTVMRDVSGKPSRKRKEEDGKQLDDILQWLNGFDCTEKHEFTLDLRQSDTCMWLPDTYAYKTWRHGEHSFLWLHGKQGAGKTVLAASVIDALERSLEDEEYVVYFYCDFRSERTMDAAEVMRSLLSQLMHRFRSTIDLGDALYDLTKERGRSGFILKNAKRLARLVSSAAKQFARQPLIVIDGLDECRDTQNLLDALTILSQAALRLFVTSRPLQIIRDQFARLPSLSLEKMSAAVSADIQLHVTREIDADRRLRIAPARLKEEIRFTLCENADGMFRWVQCQLDTLKRCMTPTDIREALESLPKGLEETYRQILLVIDKEEREAEVARRALTWLVAAFSPLRLSQIVEALSIDLDQRVLNPDLAPIHGSALLDALSSLVTHDEQTDIVILSHFSVQEYLTGELARGTLSVYYIDLPYAEGQLAQFCMCYIAAYMKQAQGFGEDGSLSHITQGGKIDFDYEELSPPMAHRAASSPPPESRPLLEYVLSHAFDHLAHVNTDNAVVLKALVALEVDVRRNPSEWGRMRNERNSSFPRWPSSEDDFVLYILIAFAPEPLLRFFLGRRRVQSKAGTNPLVYAGQLNRAEHAKTLLARGAALNQSGVWRSLQATPLEVAVHCGSGAVTDLFLRKGSRVPRRLFAHMTQNYSLGNGVHIRIVARLLQTDDFVEWAVGVQDEASLLSFLGPLDDTWTRSAREEWPSDKDSVAIIRRLVQVGCELFAHDSTRQKLFRRAAVVGHVSTLRYILSMDIPLPPGILLDVVRSADPNIATIRFLLDNGVNLHGVTDVGETALHVAIDRKVPEDQCLERVKLLVNAGCDPSVYSLLDSTPLHFATRCGFISVVRYLLSLGIPRPPDTLLSISTKHCEEKASMVIRYLLRMGADVHAVAANGDTMLHVILDCSVDAHQGTEEECLESTRILVEAGCSPHIVNSVGETPMDIAIQTGHVSVVEHFIALNVPLPLDALLKASRIWSKSPNSLQLIKLLLEKGANVGAVSADGDTALHLALASFGKDHMEPTVKLLVEAGCDPSACNNSDQTVLHIAARYRQKAIITYFLSRGVPLPRDIMVVATTGELYNFLIEQGADPLVIAKNGDTVLHVVLNRVFPERDALKLTQLLVRAGCDPSVPNSAGETPLQVAVRRGRVSVIEYLLSVKVPLPFDILFTASQPLSVSPINYRVQTIRLLVQKKVPANITTENGDTLLHLTLSSRFIKEDDALKVAQILIDAGCEPRAHNLVGETTLHAAAKGGYLSTMEYLISQGVPVHPNILLAQATSIWSNDKATITRFLISKGADIHAITANGDTALHLTLACGYELTRLKTAQILVDAGCDPSRPNLAGETPIHVAARSGFLSLVNYLRSQNVPLPSDILLAAAVALGRSHLRAQSPRIAPMFRLLIREGADVNVVTPNGDTLLHIAIRKGPNTHLNVAAQRDSEAESVHKHVTFDPWGIIRVLLCAGCDPFVRNVDGETAFELAEAQGRWFHANFLRLVDASRCGSVERSDLSRLSRPVSSAKRGAEEVDQDMVGRVTKRGRLLWSDDVGDEDERAEVDEQLMA